MARKINKNKVGLVIVLILVIIIFFSISIYKIFNINEIKNENTIKNSQDSLEELPEKVDKNSITISFAGDVTMGNYKGSPYYGTFDNEFENQNQDYSYFFNNVEDIFSKDDLSIVNLEGTLTTATNAKVKKFAFRGNPAYINILKSGNIEAVTLSNNHSEDYLDQGLKDTKFILKENNINYFGMGEQSIVNVKGVKVGLLGYNGWPENYNQQFLNAMEKEIQKLKSEVDVVTVYFHWGTERKYYPDQIQKDFAHKAIDSGADAIIGSHPHVIQGIEKYKEKYIAYSLGNFCFGGNKNPSDKDSLIYQLTFNLEDNKLISIEEPNVIPCSISSTNSRNNYQPTPTEGSESERIINKLKDISKNLNN